MERLLVRAGRGAGAEVDTPAESFTTMAAPLERTEHVRRRVLSEPAHGLRTPVAVRTAHLEGTEGGADRGLSLCVEADPGLGAVDMDRHRMGQAIGTLLPNTLRYTLPGGEVVLGACSAGSGEVEVRVADTGEGMTAEQLPHVFGRFRCGDAARDRDHGGSGIGLTISRALVEAHGGALTAGSPGRGALFVLTVPAARGGAARGGPATPWARRPCCIPLGGIR